ncbi:MAG: hypothetical protein ABSG74_02065 [Candidatus Bathyarchaeia archaeon]|jgi:hypothetical protein
MVDRLTVLERELDSTVGILRMTPTYVARDSFPALGRLGVKKIKVGARGWISERWFTSSVLADNVHKVPNEGLSYINLTERAVKMSFAEALDLNPGRMLGHDYSKEHGGRFGVLTKICDIGLPVAWHIHAGKEDAKKYWNANPKEEAIYFLESTNRGPLPYSHLGVHSWVTPDDVLPIVKRWNDDKVLDLSPAYRLNIGEGYHIFPGIPHASGTALGLEVQEESDVGNMLQAFVNGVLLPKEAMLKGLPDEEAVMRLVDWEKAGDPGFYRKYHIVPETIDEPKEGEPIERWIFNPNRSWKFSGKELRIPPGRSFDSKEKGAYLLLGWKGHGRVKNVSVKAGDDSMDELFVSHEAATEKHSIVNSGRQELVLYKLFGPDVNKVPTIYR